MIAHVRSCTVRGVDALPLRVEVGLASGLPSFTVVGLAQSAVREGRERVAAALRSSGFGLPHRRITVNLAPADLRKEGTGFDLPIAVGILAAAGAVPPDRLEGAMLLGELGLDGAVRAVPGVISAAVLAGALGVDRLLVPSESAGDARLVPGVAVEPVGSLGEAVALLGGPMPDAPPARGAGAATGGREGTSRDLDPSGADPARDPLDLADVQGQALARRALEIAAAGEHDLLLVGPPGVGKTMLARRIPGILPPLRPEEALEVARIHSVAGLLDGRGRLPARPFRAPHHTVSYARLVGGGSPIRPGEISLAHRGVLFLDELPEFRRDAIEVLRQPLEEGEIEIGRVQGAVRFPARFLLVAAMNPCPCGHRGDGTDRCTCDAATMARYRRRVSGPLLDRIDLRVEAQPPRFDGAGAPAGETSAEVAARVAKARSVQRGRFTDEPHVTTNGAMQRTHIDAWCPLTPHARRLLRRVGATGRVSLRGRDRILRLARTIADLDASDSIAERHLAEAVQYRAGAEPGVVA